MKTDHESLFRLSSEVRDALDRSAPVVALETTLIVHGLPPEDRAIVARRIEDSVRAAGAVPATIACLRGRVLVGLDDPELEELTSAPKVEKLSLASLAGCLVRRTPGATTVATTAHLAAAVGVRVFATGGLGGVHPGAAESFDISADLTMLARTPIVAVCAGVKSILDVGATFELLETLGVPVVGLGTESFPGFYVAETDHRVTQVGSAAEIAELRRTHDALGLSGAIVTVFPPPADVTLPRAEHDAALAEAISEAEEAGVHGAALSPFLLARLSAKTGGRTTDAGLAIIYASASIAAAIARELTR